MILHDFICVKRVMMETLLLKGSKPGTGSSGCRLAKYKKTPDLSLLFVDVFMYSSSIICQFTYYLNGV